MKNSRNQAKRNRYARSKRRQNYYRTIQALTPESLESRLPLDASGFVGNACAPDLDLSAIGVQSTRVNEEIVIDLRAAGATVTDVDADGNPTGDTIRLQLDPDDGPANATLTADGVFRWTPTEDQVGSFEFVVIAIDEGDPPLADAEVFVVEVVQENGAPDLAAISNSSATVGEVLEISLAASDPDGDMLTFLLDPDLTIDGVTIEQTDNNNAVLRWTPAATDAGQSFDFSVLVVDDGFPPMSDNERFVVSVMTVNAVDDAYSVAADQSLTIDAASGVLANDVESDGNVLTATIVAEPANGTLSFSADGSFSYFPVSGFHGTDTFTYQAQDSVGNTSNALVTITVNPINSTPVAADDVFSVEEDAILSVDANTGVLANDSDADGDTLTATLVQGPQSGVLSLNADGSFDYTPEANFSGDVSFTYTTSDGLAESSAATATISVIGTNDAPVAVPDNYETTEDTELVITDDLGLLVNDTDEDGDTLTVTIADAPTNGIVNLDAGGGFTYTPNANYNGVDTFSYTVSDGDNTSGPAAVSISVTAVNDAPVANPDTYLANEGVELTIDSVAGVLANDVDVDGDTLTAQLLSGTSDGSVTLNADGSFTYMSNTGFSGTDSFTYQISDGELDSTVVTVAILVNDVNQAPMGAGDSYQAVEDEVLVVDAAAGLLANDSDADGDTLSAILVNQPGQGALTLNADGSFEYTASQNSSGLDGFSYRVSDGTSTSAEVLVVVVVTTSNDAPIAVDDAYEAVEGDALIVTAASGVLANDSDIEGDAITASLASQTANGTVDLQSDGSFTYTPDASFTGTDTFTYQASDGTDLSAVATVSIDVISQNQFAITSGAAVGSVVGTVVPAGQFTSPVIYQFADVTVDPDLLLNADDHISGDPTAPVVLIEYLDLQCPACAAFHPIVEQLEDEFAGDLLVVRRHFPLENIHLNARAAARAAEAAGRQGMFEEMADLMFTNQDDWEFVADPTSFFETYATDLGLDLDQFRADVADPAVDARITRDLDTTNGLGATGTPTFFLNNVRIPNPGTGAEFVSLIQDAVDAVEDDFAVNRETGEIIVIDNSSLASQNLSVLVTDVEDNTETIDVVINVMDTSGGGVMALALAVDEAIAGDDDWLAV